MSVSKRIEQKGIFMKQQRLFKKGIIGLVCSIILIVIDQLAKAAAVTHLRGQESLVLWDGVFELRYLENHGAAFGLLQNQRTFFIISTVILLILLVYLYLKRIPDERRYQWLNVIIVLYIAGAVGNFIDRLLNEYVIDFFYFVLIDFPIFNIADIYVVVSTGLLLVLGFFFYKEEDFERIFPSKKKKNSDTAE